MNPDMPATETKERQTKKTRRMVAWLLVTVVGMFAFAVFLLPPMYDAFCKLTGLNGKLRQTQGVAAPKPLTAAEQQAATITLQFLANKEPTMPWVFKPDVTAMKIIPGQVYKTHFYVKNLSEHAMVGRAIPSMSPERVSQYLNKIECFCFQEQPLAAGEEKEMAMSFYLDKNFPKDIKEFTLSYTLYKVEKPAAAQSSTPKN